MAQLNGLLVTGNSRFLNKINGDISGDAHTLDGKTITDTYSSTSTNAMSGKAVKQALDGLPEPMVFQGSVGTGGTKTWANLPAPSSTGTTKNVGHTYKAIEARTTSQTPALTANVKIGDTIISDGTNWVVIPSGDEDGTVTNIATGAELTGGPITSTGTISHSTSGVTAGTYRSVTVNTYGHVTNGTNPTTINGYGITDAKIADGVITLGNNTITPLTSASTLDATKLSGTVPSGCYTDTKNTAGNTDTSSKIYLIGATSQTGPSAQTYSQDTAYVDTNGHIYSHSKQVVNLSDTQALTNKTYNGYTLAAACAKAVVTSVDTSASLPTSNAVKTFVEGKGYVTTDTKNTTGSTDTSSKIYLVGATSQAANPQTYSDNEVYTTSGVLTTKSVQVGVGVVTMQYNSTTQAIDFIFN